MTLFGVTLAITASPAEAVKVLVADAPLWVALPINVAITLYSTPASTDGTVEPAAPLTVNVIVLVTLFTLAVNVTLWPTIKVASSIVTVLFSLSLTFTTASTGVAGLKLGSPS